MQHDWGIFYSEIAMSVNDKPENMNVEVEINALFVTAAVIAELKNNDLQ
ncbi:hypothetical protein OI450_05495 [Pectobacterium cacticida]|nr:hypothetical protein [Pectobacterium cacticida]UYX07834.1 hypothetical protein OI450_05495 [Pectobacterium cacticida]